MENITDVDTASKLELNKHKPMLYEHCKYVGLSYSQDLLGAMTYIQPSFTTQH